jgi:hypothetical protein
MHVWRLMFIMSTKKLPSTNFIFERWHDLFPSTLLNLVYLLLTPSSTTTKNV